MKITSLMKKAFLTFAVIAIAVPAMALSLNEARSKGQVGEKLDGYVQALSSGSDVNKLVAEVNARRKAEYERISKENGQPASVVGKLAAGQIINGLPKGSKYQSSDGSWKTK